MAGGDGSVWARRTRLLHSDPVVWSVFAADGTLRGELTLPDNVSLTDPRVDRALVIWRDALDVPFLRVYRIGGILESADSRGTSQPRARDLLVQVAPAHGVRAFDDLVRP